MIFIETIRYDTGGKVDKSTFIWLKQILNFVIPIRLTCSSELDFEKFTFDYSINLPIFLLVSLTKLKKSHFCMRAIVTRKLQQKEVRATLIIGQAYPRVVLFRHRPSGLAWNLEYVQHRQANNN